MVEIEIALGLAVVAFAAGYMLGRGFGDTTDGVPLIGGDDDDVQPGSIFSVSRREVIPYEASLDEEDEPDADEHIWVLEVSHAPLVEGPWSPAEIIQPLTPQMLPGIDEWTQAWKFTGPGNTWIRARYTRMRRDEYERRTTPS